MMDPSDKGVIEQQIADWVRQHVVLSHPSFGKCRKLILRHMNLEHKPQGDVTAVVISQDEALIGEIDMIVNKIVDAAQRSANDFSAGLQTYALYAYYPDEPQFVPYKMFRVAAEDNIDRGNLEPSELPTEKGLVSQLMRHNEAIMKNSIMQGSYLFSIFQREMTRLTEKDARHEQQQLDMVMLQQDVLNEAHGRRLKEREAETNIAMREGVFEQLKVLMPILANRLTGKQIFPEEDKSFLLMATFLENLTPEQQIWLRDKLTEPQTALLAEILGEYEKKKAAFSANAPKTPPSEAFRTKGGLPSSVPSGQLPPLPDNTKSDKLFGTLTERLEDPSAVSNDPQIQKLEDRATQFMSRFNGFLNPDPKKPGNPPPTENTP